MLASGWMEEVRGLVASGLPADAKPFDFIGYRELQRRAHGEMKLEKLKPLSMQANCADTQHGQLTGFAADTQDPLALRLRARRGAIQSKLSLGAHPL